MLFVYAVAVAVTFFVCWAPFHAQRIITSCVNDDEWTPALIEFQHGLFHVSGMSYTTTFGVPLHKVARP